MQSEMFEFMVPVRLGFQILISSSGAVVSEQPIMLFPTTRTALVDCAIYHQLNQTSVEKPEHHRSLAPVVDR